MNMYVALLGRQPALGNAELERLFGGGQVTPLSPLASLVDTPQLDIERLGGTLKAGKVILDLPTGDWHKVSQKIVQHYSSAWTGHEGKITLGVSSYGFSANAREVQKLGIILKQKLKASGVSLRLIPNTDPALSSATSHHNKLGLAANKVELLIVRGKKRPSHRRREYRRTKHHRLHPPRSSPPETRRLCGYAPAQTRPNNDKSGYWKLAYGRWQVSR